VARHEGRVLFVRHALPGERVLVEVTEGTDRDRYLRADAVRVLSASPQRVEPPCPYAGPGLCGGCDFQHVALPAQRDLKATVVREQLARLAGLDVPVVVEPVPGDAGGLRWRTRIRWARTPDGRQGLRKHRSHDVVPVDDCLIARGDARHGRGVVTEHVRGHGFEVDADGFWQVHPGAPEALVAAVLAALEPRSGERALDLYAGVGLFSLFLAEAVGVAGHVLAVEGDRRASEHAAANLASYPWAAVTSGRVDRAVAGLAHADVVVLDPPREGAKRAVVEAVASLAPRAVAYVACDPAALARDTAIFAESGYHLTGLRAFDLFPMTHHVECVALLEETG
jgi:tRNA/tmRNA/rRNA uracil-C5-methylase (TrmA/RlmC/RlmD family)